MYRNVNLPLHIEEVNNKFVCKFSAHSLYQTPSECIVVYLLKGRIVRPHNSGELLGSGL
jgi:hypothetical protein